MKRLLASLAGVLLCGVASAADRKPYAIYFYDNPPFVVVDGETLGGIATNVVRALFDRAQVPYRLEPMPLARALNDVQTRPMTCVFPVQRAQDIEAEYRWISPILVSKSGLIMAPDLGARIITLSDAKKYKIGALRGSGDAEYLRRFGFDVDVVLAQEQAVKMLLSKRIDIWAADVLSQRHFLKGHAGKEKLLKGMVPFRVSLSSLACNYDMAKADVAKLQSTMDAMLVDGSVKRLTDGKR